MLFKFSHSSDVFFDREMLKVLFCVNSTTILFLITVELDLAILNL